MKHLATPLPTVGGGGSWQPQNDGIVMLEVATPVLVKATITDFHEYPIVGKDSNGNIECQRRFNLFYEFRQALICHFPGLFIPPLPAKKVTGGKEEFTLIERQHFLNLFLKECCEILYIA